MSDLFSPDFVNELFAFVSRHLLMSGAWVGVLVLLVAMQFRIVTARVKKTSVTLATMKVNRENGVFVDVRNADTFSGGHIANSVNITSADIKNGKINRIERNKETPVILVGKDKFDTECFNSARALKKQGFLKVFILEGGIMEWSNQNLPLSNRK